ncbi:MAG: hypothetical protein H0V76_05250 [Blastocatellia bacterium]|nr:hypothetical protein [Blastocatellia bacterium]
MADMIFKDLDAGIARVWEGLRPTTKKMLVGALQSNSSAAVNPSGKFAYDAHSDWEISRLLTALDSHSKRKSAAPADEASRLAETCAKILESQSASAEVFIQLATRAIRQHDYQKLDELSDRLLQRFSAGEIAEVVRQTELPQIRAIAYETLSFLDIGHLVPLLDDALYSDIAAGALEQKAFEYDSEEAREVLEQFDNDLDR